MRVVKVIFKLICIVPQTSQMDSCIDLKANTNWLNFKYLSSYFERGQEIGYNGIY